MSFTEGLFDFSGKVALVTGGSRGLGKFAAMGLAEKGANIVVSSRKQDMCEKAAAEIHDATGVEVLAHAAHVGELGQLDKLIDATYERFGKIDILINNAGISPAFKELSECEEPLFDKLFDVNVKGPWYLASRAAPRMAKHGGGTIINVISVGGLRPGAGVGIYTATKATLHAFTKVMAQEWAPLNIRVNSLAPGPFRTDMFEAALSMPGFGESSINATVLKRIAEPEEIIGTILFLAGDASSYVTGEVLVADGGMLLI